MKNNKPSLGGTKILALIPARSGSKGIPQKNVRPLRGKPLLAHAIDCARGLASIDRIVLSTDSTDMADIGRQFGAEVPFIRPADLAADTTPMLDVLQHAVRFVSEADWDADIVVLLQPTAPFRRSSDVEAAINLLKNNPHADSVVSIEEIPGHYSPTWAIKIVDDCMVPFMPDGLRVTRRQDAPKAYTRNGQFYVIRRSTLIEKNSIYGSHIIPFITTHAAVNLDTLDDWEAAERLAEKTGLPL